MSPPKMQALKCQYFTDPDTGIRAYDLVNKYQTDPLLSSPYQIDPLEVIKSKLIFRLGTAKGEWKDDLDFGIPLTALKANTTNPDLTAQLIADEILKVQNVTSAALTEKDFNASTRRFTAAYNVGTIYGTTTAGVTI